MAKKKSPRKRLARWVRSLGVDKRLSKSLVATVKSLSQDDARKLLSSLRKKIESEANGNTFGPTI